MEPDLAPGDRLLARYANAYPDEVAALVTAAPPDEAAELASGMAPATAAEILDRANADEAAAIVRRMARPAALGVLALMDPSRAASALQRLDDETANGLLAGLDDAVATDLRDLMQYPPQCAGSLMQARVPLFQSGETVLHALQRLRDTGLVLQDLVIVGEQDRLQGIVPVARIAVAQEDAVLGDMIATSPPHVLGMASREEVLEALSHRRLSVLPVVDTSLRVLGVIDQATLMRAVEEEVSADIQTMVGASKDERALSSPFFAVRKRLPWLNVNLLTAFLAAAVVGLFESTIAQFTALAVLLPVVAGQSGNTGAQALAVIMRGLALREIRLRHAPRVLVKEALSGLLNGIAIAVVTCIGVFIWSQSWGLCLVIGIAMIISMLLAGLSGAAIPLILTAFRQDPAQSGSIILTTVTDIVGFFSFLGLATVFSSLL